MKSVLISIRPEWVEKIVKGEKTIEVRKTVPKWVPFKAYIYCTKDKPYLYGDMPIKEFYLDNGGYKGGECNGIKLCNGKVIGEFICDKIEDFYCASVPYLKENNLGYGQFVDNGVYKVNGWNEGIVFERNDRYIETMINNDDLKEMCLSAQELFDYIGVGKHLYAWHISDLKIYDKPKELSEFTSPRVCGNYKDLPAYIHVGCNICEYSYTINCMIKCRIDGRKPLTRPPQSYMFVEEVEE